MKFKSFAKFLGAALPVAFIYWLVMSGTAIAVISGFLTWLDTTVRGVIPNVGVFIAPIGALL